ncbi:PREDICTED: protein lethal(2)k10201 isoform X2 [Papilio polytes]|uniref:protein lethal(2)k10201 isoform X2 n=1 Tax=Papilio polytes TaxID=76194 RepID=UPI00067624C4|nr:PREDICTED: protein lethal(2)k10201 isoform X2 [Papilio polytes]
MKMYHQKNLAGAMRGEALMLRLAGAGAGAGARKLHHGAFSREAPPARLGVRHLDDELICRDPGTAGRALACGRCGRALASPHLLDLHVQEEHDSFFAALAASRPSYCCYIEECKEKFLNPEERFDHCVKAHKLPKDFRFYQKPKIPKNKNVKNDSMDVDNEVGKSKLFTLNNSKVKAFVKSCKRASLESENSLMSVDSAGAAPRAGGRAEDVCKRK